MPTPYVHPTAVVDSGAVIGPGTKIWHFVHVSSDAVIGANSALGQNVFIGQGVVVGARVRIQNNVSVYEGVAVADDVFLGPSCVFTNVVNPRAEVRRRSEYKTTHVGRGATVGANATIVCGNQIGAYAFVGAGAVVTHDIASYALVVGNPGRQVGYVCRCGVRLPVRVDACARVGCGDCGRQYDVDTTGCRPV